MKGCISTTSRLDRHAPTKEVPIDFGRTIEDLYSTQKDSQVNITQSYLQRVDKIRKAIPISEIDPDRIENTKAG